MRPHGPVIRLAMLIVNLVKIPNGLALMVEDLDLGNAGEALLQERRKLGNRRPHIPKARPGMLAEHDADEQDKRGDRNVDESQPRTEVQHRGERADQGQNVSGYGYQARGEEFVEHIDIARRPRHQPSARRAVEVLYGQALQVPENLAANVTHDPLAGVVHRVDLRRAGARGHDQHHEIDSGDSQEALQGVVRQERIQKRRTGRIRPEVPVHGKLREERPACAQRRIQHEQHERGGRRVTVGAQVLPEPLQQDGVIDGHGSGSVLPRRIAADRPRRHCL